MSYAPARFAKRLHPAELGSFWFRLLGRRLFNTDDAQNWSTDTKLYVRANSDFDGLGNRLAIHERAEARFGIADQIASRAQTKLGMLARHHRPLFLGKEVMTHGRIAPDQDDLTGERMFAVQLTVAILC